MKRRQFTLSKIAPFMLMMTLTAFIPAIAGAPPEASTRPATRQKLPERHAITGLVTAADGKRIQSFVFVLDAETGLPYSNVTDHPFIDSEGGDLGTHVLSGTDGRFMIPGLFPGQYRFIAQSWEGDQSAKSLLDMKSDTTTLCGIVENVNITENQKPPFVMFRPVGTATVHVTFKQSDTILLVSTRPLSGDPILPFFACCKGEFLQNLVGAIYMRHGAATMHGLPAGNLYFYAFINGDGQSPQGFGSASAIPRAGETVEVPIPLTSSINGELKLPDRLVPLEKSMMRDPKPIQAAVAAVIPPSARFPFDMPLDREIALSDGETVTLRDVITLASYATFNREARELAKNPSVTPPPAGR